MFFFFFNDTPPTAIYTLSLHDALPISPGSAGRSSPPRRPRRHPPPPRSAAEADAVDRKSTRLNSSHRTISYAVFCLKKKKKNKKHNKHKIYPHITQEVHTDITDRHIEH